MLTVSCVQISTNSKILFFYEMESSEKIKNIKILKHRLCIFFKEIMEREASLKKKAVGFNAIWLELVGWNRNIKHPNYKSFMASWYMQPTQNDLKKPPN